MQIILTYTAVASESYGLNLSIIMKLFNLKGVTIAASLCLAGCLSAHAAPFKVGDEVQLKKGLYGRVLTVDGHQCTVEVFTKTSDKPSGEFTIPGRVYNAYPGTDPNPDPDGEDWLFIPTAIAEKGFLTCPITSITIPANITSIGTEAFYGCTSLTEINENTLGSIKEIGMSAFAHTLALRDVNLQGVKTVGQQAFWSSGVANVNLPKVETIGPAAFQECPNLENVSVGLELTEIGNIAFATCPKLTGITLGPKLTTVGVNAFSRTESLKEIVLPRNLQTLGRAAFEDSGLERVFILAPNAMEYLDDSSLLENTSITRIYAITDIASGLEEHIADELQLSIPVKTMDSILTVKNLESSITSDFELLPQINGIDNIHVFSNDMEVNATDGVYSVSSKSIDLEYYIDGINFLSYPAEVGKTSGIKDVELPSVKITNRRVSASVPYHIYDINGIELPEDSSLSSGIYFIATPEGVLRIAVQ